jgi:hypothetical protein
LGIYFRFGTVREPRGRRRLRRLQVTPSELAHLKDTLNADPERYLDEMQSLLKEFSGIKHSYKAIINAPARIRSVAHHIDRT